MGEFALASLSGQNEANTEVGREAAQAVHRPIYIVPRHGGHDESAVNDPVLPERASRCDDRAVLQDGRHQTEDIFL